MWAIYMDVHVPRAVSDAVRRCGIDVLTSQQDQADQLTDEELLERAVQQQRLLFTQDSDFFRIASRWQMQGRSFPGIIYGHQLHIGIGRVIEDLELICKCGQAPELESRVIVLPLS